MFLCLLKKSCYHVFMYKNKIFAGVGGSVELGVGACDEVCADNQGVVGRGI